MPAFLGLDTLLASWHQSDAHHMYVCSHRVSHCKEEDAGKKLTRKNSLSYKKYEATNKMKGDNITIIMLLNKAAQIFQYQLTLHENS